MFLLGRLQLFLFEIVLVVLTAPLLSTLSLPAVELILWHVWEALVKAAKFMARYILWALLTVVYGAAVLWALDNYPEAQPLVVSGMCYSRDHAWWLVNKLLLMTGAPV